MATTITSCSNIHSFQCSFPKSRGAPNSSFVPFPQFFRRPNLNCKPQRLRSSYRKSNGFERGLHFSPIACLVDDTSEQEGVSIDLKLPRRSLLASFTCNACGARSERFINRLAYECGLVYVQCSGCSKYHKLVDNLGLVVEYNLLEETDLNTSEDQV